MIKIENGEVLISANDSEEAIDDLRAFMGFIRYDKSYTYFCKAINFDFPADLDEKIEMFINLVTQEPNRHIGQSTKRILHIIENVLIAIAILIGLCQEIVIALTAGQI